MKQLEKQKKQNLELIKKVKMFNTGLMRAAPKPRKIGEVAEVEVAEAEPEEKKVQKEVKPKKKSKSHANPLVKSAPKKPKMSKVKASSVVISPGTA